MKELQSIWLIYERIEGDLTRSQFELTVHIVWDNWDQLQITGQPTNTIKV